MHAIRPLIALALLFSTSLSRAEELTIYIAEMNLKELSVEMVVGARLDLDDDQENVGIVYYSLGKKIATVEVSVEKGGLKGELEAARDEPEAGPFFRDCDSYIVKDSRRC